MIVRKNPKITLSGLRTGLAFFLLLNFCPYVYPLNYSTSDCTQNNTAFTAPGAVNVEVVGIEIVMTTGGGPKALENLVFSTTGTTNPGTDIQNARVWFTGASAVFATTTPFGAVVSAPGGGFTVTGTQSLANGNNYFWLTYDVTPGAALCNAIDAELTSLDISGTTYFPGTNAPAGNRKINGVNMTYQGSTALQNILTGIPVGTSNNEIMVVEITTPGSASPLVASSFTFNTNGSTNPATDIAQATLYYTANNPQFNTLTPFGTAVAGPNGTFSFTGSQFLVACQNYFFLAYDVPSGATVANVVDAECTSITVGGTPYTPSVTAPGGNRPIDPPPVTFMKTYGGPAGSEQLNEVWQTSDGGFALAGYSNGYGAGNNDFMILKVDASGFLQFGRAYGGTAIEEANAVTQTSDGGYVIAGWTQSFGSGGSDGFGVKLDAAGTMVWDKNYGGNSGENFFGVRETSDGGLVFAGHSYSVGQGGSAYLVKTDAGGNVSWTKGYGGSGYERANWVEQTSDGGYVISGWTNSFGAGADDIYVVKAANNGNIQWTSVIGGPNVDRGQSVVQTSDGGYLIGGNTNSFGAGLFDYFLCKLDGSGNFLWMNCYGGTQNDDGFECGESADGNYYIGGQSYSLGTGCYDFYMVKTDVNGNALFGKGYGDVDCDFLRSIKTTADGGYVMAGFSDGFASGFAYDWMLVKTGPDGDVGCLTVDALPTVTIAAPLVGSGGSAGQGGNDANPATVASTAGVLEYIGCNPNLPAASLRFSGEFAGANRVILRWENAGETGVDLYEVQRAAEAGNFAGIGYVRAGAKTYGFEDPEAPDTGAWYRLKFADANGGAHFSEILFLQPDAKIAPKVLVYPNPADDRLYLVIKGMQPQRIEYAIRDMFGKHIVKQNIQISKQIDTWEIDVKSIPLGVYILNLNLLNTRADRPTNSLIETVKIFIR